MDISSAPGKLGNKPDHGLSSSNPNLAMAILTSRGIEFKAHRFHHLVDTPLILASFNDGKPSSSENASREIEVDVEFFTKPLPDGQEEFDPAFIHLVDGTRIVRRLPNVNLEDHSGRAMGDDR